MLYIGKFYGGLPPEGPTINPRRGSTTGSYALPVPPEWLRSQRQESNRKRGSGNKQLLMDGSFTKSRSGSIEMLPGWLGSVLSGTLVTGPVHGISSGQTILQKDRLNENKAVIPLSKTENVSEKDPLLEVIAILFYNTRWKYSNHVEKLCGTIYIETVAILICI